MEIFTGTSFSHTDRCNHKNEHTDNLGDYGQFTDLFPALYIPVAQSPLPLIRHTEGVTAMTTPSAREDLFL